jgi:N-acetylmuramoyl-L-alanine amidase
VLFRILSIIVAGILLLALPCPAAPLSNLRVTAAAGERYVSLKDVAAAYGLTLRVPLGKKVYLQGKWNSWTFEVESRQASFNGTMIWLLSPMLKYKGKWMITESDAREIVDPLMRPYAYIGARGYRVVVLDPGHGGPDAGARGKRGVEEKRVVLDVAMRARVHLANAGFKVYLTRETDRYIELDERGIKAARWAADAFVSIHLNSAPSSAPKGLETFVLSNVGYPSTSSSSRSRGDKTAYPGNRFEHSNTVLGYFMQKALLEKAKGEDRGLKRARFLVLRNAPCPAALVECGFLSNPGEEKSMLDAAHREAIAVAISKGIIDYFNAVKKARVSAP